MVVILSFKCLTLEDKEIIEKYINKSKLDSYEYLFSSLYMWRKLNNIKYAVIDDVLIIEKNEEGKGTFYAQLFGYNKDNFTNIIDELIKRNLEFTDRDYLFGDVGDEFVDDLKKYTDFSIDIVEDIDDSEYIYNTQDLIELKGKKYHSKKNHVNSFLKTYSYDKKQRNQRNGKAKI